MRDDHYVILHRRGSAKAILQTAKFWTLQIEKIGDISPTSWRSRGYSVILKSSVSRRY